MLRRMILFCYKYNKLIVLVEVFDGLNFKYIIGIFFQYTRAYIHVCRRSAI